MLFKKKLINKHRILLLTTSKRTHKIRHMKKTHKRILKRTLKIRHKKIHTKKTHKKTFKIRHMKKTLKIRHMKKTLKRTLKII